jgi:tripartite-type tricarboxylate transporter receptor subunit TctC
MRATRLPQNVAQIGTKLDVTGANIPPRADADRRQGYPKISVHSKCRRSPNMQGLPFVHAARIAAVAFGVGLSLAAGSTAAQEYPVRDIRAICAYAAGSGADILVRYYSDRIAKLAGRPVIVENKAGAQGLIGTEFAARAEPDGYTILVTPASANLAAAPHLFKNLRYDPIRDFTPVAPISRLNFMVAVDGRSPIKSIAELVSHLKVRAEKGSYGIGNNTGQVSAAILSEMAGLKTVQISYKAAAQALIDLASGQLDYIVWDATFLSGQAKSGRVRLLAVTGSTRSSSLPEVPTMIESGFPGFDLSAWWGVVVPAGTPRPIVEKLAGWIAQINAAEETRQFLNSVATDVLNGTPESMAAMLKTDTERWRGFAKLAKIEPQ